MDDLEKLFEAFRTIAGTLAVFGITFELLPIKIYPLKWLGDRLTKSTNNKIDKIQKQVNKIEYENDMKDLRNIKSRLHGYGMMIKKGEKLSHDTLKSALDDLDVYDFYKETYNTMEINGRNVKINGEIEIDRQLIVEQYKNIDSSIHEEN